MKTEIAEFKVIPVKGVMPIIVLPYLYPKKYAIRTDQGEVNRSEVLKVIHALGYTAKTGDHFISRIGFNTIYFEGDKWANWAKYDTSWDWLMPCLTRIERLGWNTVISYNDETKAYLCSIHSQDDAFCKTSGSKLQATYAAIIEFIKYIEDRK